ncbi:hypothetical protein L226DRAFT_251729 [Lentinus tigrinus ALCF2SS1-7]|uniref:uncharacterized protein n=1 Tax=Lentinus tigrinus ALCF2SS1-7 TaxID=1328758 RepID=UPI0011662411|nr:hypothetical protein L226DRAFT_251729 [Lentinus tigrinus ALCF2SS1-7]
MCAATATSVDGAPPSLPYSARKMVQPIRAHAGRAASVIAGETRVALAAFGGQVTVKSAGTCQAESKFGPAERRRSELRACAADNAAANTLGIHPPSSSMTACVSVQCKITFSGHQIVVINSATAGLSRGLHEHFSPPLLGRCPPCGRTGPSPPRNVCSSRRTLPFPSEVELRQQNRLLRVPRPQFRSVSVPLPVRRVRVRPVRSWRRRCARACRTVRSRTLTGLSQSAPMVMAEGAPIHDRRRDEGRSACVRDGYMCCIDSSGRLEPGRLPVKGGRARCTCDRDERLSAQIRERLARTHQRRWVGSPVGDRASAVFCHSPIDLEFRKMWKKVVASHFNQLDIDADVGCALK